MSFSKLPATRRRPSTRSETGSILILTALSMVVLLGMAALAVDGSYMYTERNRMAAAADAGAKSGAWELFRGNGSGLSAFANREAVLHGFTPIPDGDADVITVTPPNQGRFAGVPGYVQVSVARNTATFLGTILGWADLRPRAIAVAGTSAGPNCIITLNSAGNPSLDVGGTVDLDVSTCNIQASGNMEVGNGSGSFSAGSIGVEGTCSGCPGGITTQGTGPASDPLSTLPVPTNPYSTPQQIVIANNTPTPTDIAPGWYSKIDIGNSDVVNFTPGGLYWLSGPMIIGNSATVNGTGVFFYLAGTAPAAPCDFSPLSPAGCIRVPNGALVNLSAPATGTPAPLDTYIGILFFQSRTNAIDLQFGNTGDYDLSGAMYAPAATVQWGNSGGSNDCTMIVANNLILAGSGGGNMQFTNTCAAYGGSPLLTVTLAE